MGMSFPLAVMFVSSGHENDMLVGVTVPCTRAFMAIGTVQVVTVRVGEKELLHPTPFIAFS